MDFKGPRIGKIDPDSPFKITWVAGVAIVIIIAATFCSFTPICRQMAMENDLAMWFQLRGARAAPEEVAIVNLDMKSAARLGLPESPAKWPRTIYQRLINILARAHVAAIVMDINFSDTKNPADNQRLAHEMAKAGNVLLFEYMKQEVIPFEKSGAGSRHLLVVERVVPPLPIFAKSAAAIAPFPLPKVPVRLSRFWTFKSTLGEVPTLPVLALFLYALKKESAILDQLKDLFPSIADKLPVKGRIDQVAKRLRCHLIAKPQEATRALSLLKKDNQPGHKNLLRAIIHACAGPETPFLNFYGPPGQIRTIPCYKIFHGTQKADLKKLLSGKVVFIGAARENPSEQKDGFYTVFTRPDGLDLSGVEIAATAFSNLLKMETVKPVHWWMQLILISIWALFTVFIASFLPPALSFVSFSIAAFFYLFSGLFLFKHLSLFLPLMVPIIFPCLPAYMLVVLWQYSRIRAERKNISEAFRHYLPPQVVDRLARDRAFISSPPQRLYGVCLITDAESYTSLSEHMDPEELAAFMNRYYETLFGPIKRHGGVVSDVLGDSMLAIWTGSRPANHFKDSAARAAIEIRDALKSLKERSQPIHLPTRIGLHSGYLALGHIGTPDHYEFTPIGDIVNTASRIEGLNKHLGSTVLASEDVVKDARDLLTREVGTFLLAGKSVPVVIYEIICTMGKATSAQHKLCNSFARALQQFKDKNWREALKGFMECGQDGPARFYQKMCSSYLKDPPRDDWTGIIKLDRK